MGNKKIYIHIGHGKTGSTALQCFLAQNSKNLSLNKILYHNPGTKEFSNALKNKINSGNIDPNNDWMNDHILTVIKKNPDYEKYIFSNENLFHNLKPFIDYIKNEGKNNLYEFVIILCVRNPIEMLLSEYNQNIKREGYYENLTKFFLEKNFTCIHTSKSRNIIKKLEKLEVKYLLFNYSWEKSNIIKSLSKKLDIFDISNFDNIDQKIINRSLSNHELLLVRFINKFYGKKIGSVIADKIVNYINSPIKKEKFEFDNELISKIRENNIKNIRFLNKRIPKEKNLNMKVSNFFNYEELDFSNYEDIFFKEINLTIKEE